MDAGVKCESEEAKKRHKIKQENREEQISEYIKNIWRENSESESEQTNRVTCEQEQVRNKKLLIHKHQQT